ncbi:MAG: FtsW/RodA/SpoVE family cell cycle protein [Bacilli bacterium]|nr:FtsW/RodA/SpoVE family cell cycle protein [Bacilli bacterium]
MTRLLNKLDKVLLLFSFIMFIFGLFMIFDASSMKSYLNTGSNTTYFYKQLIILVISLIATIIIIQIPTSRYKRYILPGAIALIAFLGLLLLVGGESNGAKSWFYVFGFGFQPSEFAKVGIIIFMSVYYKLTYKRVGTLLTTSIPIIIGALMTFLTFLQPDAGTGLILFVIVASLYYMAPVLKKYKFYITMFGLGLIFILAIVVLIFKDSMLTRTQLDRFNFLKPCTRYQENTGYQVCNGYIAINSGKLFSVSPGNSKQKYLYLPEAYTDFIFPIIVEEFGLITGIVLILIYLLIIYRIILVGKNSSNIQNQMLCFGVAVFIFSHVVINLVGVLGLLPLTGVPLPFLSYGGSFALTVSIGLAIVQRVSIENYDERKRKVLD